MSFGVLTALLRRFSTFEVVLVAASADGAVETDSSPAVKATAEAMANNLRGRGRMHTPDDRRPTPMPDVLRENLGILSVACGRKYEASRSFFPARTSPPVAEKALGCGEPMLAGTGNVVLDAILLKVGG